MFELVKLQKIIGESNLSIWIFESIISNLAFSYISCLLFSSIFNVKISLEKRVRCIFLETYFKFIATIILPFPYYIATNIIVNIISYAIYFRESLEKCILGEVINQITVVSTEVIFLKLFYIIMPQINSYVDSFGNLTFKNRLIFSMFISRFLICMFIRNKNIKIDITNNLSYRNRNIVGIVSVISCIILFFYSVEMTYFIDVVPYSTFILNLISLVLFCYISMKYVIKLTVIETKDMKIQNLEDYNKTLSTMCDTIKGFKHDFSNFVQALDGYVNNNDIDGVRKMSNSILKDCSSMNNMGNLDPKLINNSAVYSIITKKYYLAQDFNITMNIEVLMDFKDIKIGTYELCRILAILLDNAIEAARECDEKIINVRFIKEKELNREVIIIENSYNKIDIDLDKIFEKGYSTKSDSKLDHGLGLWNVRKILKNNSNLNLFTKKEKLFCQQLEIYN